MGINTQSFTTPGVKTPFDYSGGEGTVIVTGENPGQATLLYSLDDVNYALVGSVKTGGFNFKLPACKLNWSIDNNGGPVNPIIVATVESLT